MENPGECSVCYDKYNESERRPRNLPCGHCFCTSCLGDIIEAGQVSCPTCRATHNATDVEQFPISYAVEALLKMIKVGEPTQTSLTSAPASAGIGITMSPGAEGSSKKQTASFRSNLNSLLEEQKNLAKGLLIGQEDIQSQLNQYCVQLNDWTTEHLQQQDALYSLLDQHKAAVQLLEQEKNRIVALTEEGEEEKKNVKAALESLQAVNTTQELVAALDYSDHCIEMKQAWMEKCNFLPDIKSVTTSWKVRDDTRTALETVSVQDEDGAIRDGATTSLFSKLQEDPTLCIMDRVKILTKEPLTVGRKLCSMSEPIKRLLKSGTVVYGVQEDQGNVRHSKIALAGRKVYFQCLQNGKPPKNAPTLPVGDVLGILDQSSILTFFLLRWDGSGRYLGEHRKGIVYIRLRPDNTLATQFMMLCTGQSGSSYIKSGVLEVLRKGQPEERVRGGDYESNNGEGGSSLVTHTGEEYWGSGKAGTVMAAWEPNNKTSAQFTISTNDCKDKWPYVFGQVESGLDVVKEAITTNCLSSIQIIVPGVVLPL